MNEDTRQGFTGLACCLALARAGVTCSGAIGLYRLGIAWHGPDGFSLAELLVTVLIAGALRETWSRRPADE